MLTHAIINSRIRKKSALRGIELLNESHVHRTEYHKHAIELCEKIIEDTDLIIVIGGDGTFNEVLQVIGKRIEEEQEIPRLAFVPGGSANDFARNLRLPTNIQEVLSLSAENTAMVDLGKVLRDGGTAYFLNVADYGLGAEVVERVNSAKPAINPNLSYLKAITLSFLSYRPYPVELKWEEGSWRGDIAAFTIANGASFGSGLYIAPSASTNSGQFEITRIEDLSIPEYLWNVLKLKKRKELSHKKVFYHSSKWVEVTPLNDRCALEADGEYHGTGSARFEIIPNALNLMVK